jgi:protein translocase SecG subunit
MAVLFIFLSGIMFLNSIVLILLILVQVPKKEAGAGMAFGGSAADALFGAGSGTALTTITKYSAGIFFGAALLMAIMAAHIGPAGANAFKDILTKPGALPGQTAPPLLPPAATNNNLIQLPSTATPAPANPTAPAASSNSALAPVAPPAAPPAAPPVAPPAAEAPSPAPATNK